MKSYLPMRFIGFAIIMTMLSNLVIAQKTTRGIVYDPEENPLANVRIAETATGNVVYSDEEGRFLLSYYSDENILIFSANDYDTLRKTLKFGEQSVIYLTPSNRSTNQYNLGYSVGYLDFKNKNKNKNLENMPYLLGESDIYRQLQMLPGIEQGSEGFSNLFVRGGDVDQNLILYNGVPVYNPNHLFGVSSIFHNRSIDNTAIYRGIAPSEYGGRTSSVISLESKKNAQYSDSQGEIEITPLNAGIYYENIVKGDKYFTLSARRSWLDLLLPVETKQNTANANIHDIQLNYGKSLKNKDRLDFSVLHSRDLYFQAFQSVDTVNNNVNSYGFEQKWSNSVFSGKYTQYFSPRMTAEHMLSYSGYKSSIELKQELYDSFALTGVLPTTLQSINRGIRDIGIQSNWKYAVNNSHRVSFGIQNSTKLFLIGRYDYAASNYPGLTDVTRSEGGSSYVAASEVTLYGEDRFQVNQNLLLDFGLRNVLYSFDGYTKMAVEPRLHVTSYLKNSDVLKFGYNRHNQFVNQLNLGQTGGPNNVWVPSTDNIVPQTSNVLEAGYERKLGSEYSGSINVYLKTFKNISQVSDLSDAVDPGLDWQDNVVQGTGRSTGAELLLQKSKGTITGWISYAYSTSTRRFDDLFDEDFTFTYDRPHMLKIYANYTTEYSDWNFGVNYIIGSGQLFTLPIGKYRDIDGNTQLEYNTLNNYRSPMYQRMDISFVRLKDNYELGQEWRFYLYNALNSKNPIYVSADFEDGSFTNLVVNRSSLAIVPGIAYVLKF